MRNNPTCTKTSMNPRATMKNSKLMRFGFWAACLLIFATLRHYDDNKKRTAQTLGISLKTLYNRLNAYQAQNAP